MGGGGSNILTNWFKWVLMGGGDLRGCPYISLIKPHPGTQHFNWSYYMIVNGEIYNSLFQFRENVTVWKDDVFYLANGCSCAVVY